MTPTNGWPHRGLVARIWSVKVAVGTALALLGTVNTVRNLRILRLPPPVPIDPPATGATGTPDTDPPPVTARISVLIPLRDEENRASDCLRSLQGQQFDELIVLDDDSHDGTVALVEREFALARVAEPESDRPDRTLLRTGPADEPPPPWLGKPWACQRLADRASGDVLVFLDADVVVDPDGIRRAVELLRTANLDVICPYPRQEVAGALGRLIQPLLQWSWLTTLPLDLAERSRRPSLTAGNGQFLLVDAASYRRTGGHASVADEVIEDVALVRAIKATGGTGGMVDGTDLARCRMYNGNRELIAGYTKSLWAAFGSPTGAVAALAMLGVAYLLPPAALLLGPGRHTRAVGGIGYAAAVTGRILVARRTRQRVLPDVLLQPASIAALAGLTVESFRRRRRGELRWRGRQIP
ncbi:MAG: hypothetical protein QG671_3022 [Actinomycetota bacterium]|nr:hypothetical protein [Actinomycetota bacterium]